MKSPFLWSAMLIIFLAVLDSIAVDLVNFCAPCSLTKVSAPFYIFGKEKKIRQKNIYTALKPQKSCGSGKMLRLHNLRLRNTVKNQQKISSTG
jgi:hypothetical protein